jgi:hypothetical protein
VDQNATTPIQYVIELVTELIPVPKLPVVIELLMPTLKDLFQSEAVMTDERRADLSAIVIQTLRKLGLQGVDIG